jgi:hypothetical protein
MQLSNTNYTNWKAIVLRLIADSAVVSIFYRMDTSISKVAESWAILSASNMSVYGTFGNQGPTQATFQGDFTNEVEITTPIGITES